MSCSRLHVLVDRLLADGGAGAACFPTLPFLELEGQDHVADVLSPETFAQHVLTLPSAEE